MLFRYLPLPVVSTSEVSGRMSYLLLSESMVLCKTPRRTDSTSTLQTLAWQTAANYVK
jgi:hypothetical protein